MYAFISMMATENLQAAERAARDITEDLTRQTTGCAVDIDQTEVFNPLFSPQQRLSFDPPIAVAIPTAVSFTDQDVITAASTVVMEADTGTELLNPIYVFSPEKTAFIESIETGFEESKKELLTDLCSSVCCHTHRFQLNDPIQLNHALRALHLNEYLVDLTFNEAQINADCMKRLADVLKKKSHLTKLTLMFNAIGDEGFQDILTNLSHLQLVKLELSGNQISDRYIHTLAHLISNSNFILGICLSSNKITDSGAEIIAHALERESRLQQLWLIENHLTYVGAISFGRALSRNQTLRILDLSRNSIDDRGGIALAQGLRANHTLINLNLYFCQIGDETACEFGLLFKKNKTLEFLSLSDNKISTRGFCALIDGLSENDTLEYLGLSNNQIDEDGLHKTYDKVIAHKSFLDITLEGNRIPPEHLKKLREAIKLKKNYHKNRHHE